MLLLAAPRWITGLPQSLKDKVPVDRVGPARELAPLGRPFARCLERGLRLVLSGVDSKLFKLSSAGVGVLLRFGVALILASDSELKD